MINQEGNSMKSINLLLLSSAITLVSATIIQPVVAQPNVTLHQLKVAPVHMISTNVMQNAKTLHLLPSNPINNLLNQNITPINYKVPNSVSNRLALSSVRRTADHVAEKNIKNFHSRNNFFENAMIFNEKMQQFISYFNNNSLIKQQNTAQKNHQSEVKAQQKECNA